MKKKNGWKIAFIVLLVVSILVSLYLAVHLQQARQGIYDLCKLDNMAANVTNMCVDRLEACEGTQGQYHRIVMMPCESLKR